MITIGILKNPDGRVPLTPPETLKLSRNNIKVLIEQNAGLNAGYHDTEYERNGAHITNKETILQDAEIIISIDPPDQHQITTAGKNKFWICQPFIAWNKQIAEQVAETGASLLALDAIPRITRAQPVDVLSSQATIAGYAAIILAAERIPVLMPMLSTAAGTVKPVEVLIIGAGVAGLQAIATARRLGARVYAMDVRPGTKEQVESVGGIFIEISGAIQEEKGGYAVEQTQEFIKKQQEIIADYAKRCHIIFTTAAVPGKKAPILITKEAVQNMPQGGVIVDMSARFGGNCELTKNNQEITWNGKTIIGDSNLPARFPRTASNLFSRNIFNLLQLLIKDNKLAPDTSDEIIDKSLIVWQGNIRNR